MYASSVPRAYVQVVVNRPGEGKLVWSPPEDLGCHSQPIDPDIVAQALSESFAPTLGRVLFILPGISRVDPSIGAIAMTELNKFLDMILSLLQTAEDMEAGKPTKA